MNRRLAFALLLLASCGVYSRPETRDYFKQTTGLTLCPTAIVHNSNLETAAQAGIGFIYEVDLAMDDACVTKLFRDVRAKPLKRGQTMDVSPIDRGAHLIYRG